MKVFEKLVFPNGSYVPNRIAKAAMEENMADLNHAPSEELMRLYQAWANGGVGLIITGNVMVDRRAMTGPGGVVLEDEKHLDTFKKWAQIGRSKGAQMWLQINHPGRQMQANLGQQTWAPSAISLDLGKMSNRFNTPIEMTESMIAEVIQRFANTARLGEKAGFTGVEIHAAHGYLLSQFLSPLSNKRQDQWGGSLENRARILIEIVEAVRKVVSPQFTVEQQVVKMLNEHAVDLVELSGGSYEAPAMQGQARDGRTLAREAYFLEFAQEIRKVAKMPVMVTGGIRRKQVAEKVIESGVDMVGIATALAIEPNLPNAWKQGHNVTLGLKPITWKNKTLASLANMAVVKFQLRNLSAGKKTKPNVSPAWALILQQSAMSCRTRQYKKGMRDYSFAS
ncbi:NADH:flavin oxidoreductase/NADH oxidase family protein [Acinetobacter baumannii]|uniref:NADH:flavin oxidoreductase/NADH oxidase family protein n=1 Tax=Acinetobacter baumannii TaxID=470 RepID=UPI000B943040|nr:NADH:flavin oxidoreductase/NADH oxidase family protein [Acinetobacter baumannii]OYD32813.1 2,4-dienoyl-CoA reductase [Acinetobacter baumannii]